MVRQEYLFLFYFLFISGRECGACFLMSVSFLNHTSKRHPQRFASVCSVLTLTGVQGVYTYGAHGVYAVQLVQTCGWWCVHPHDC
ncbi:hypothetical protein BJ741DRAFT_619960 [Chytriomyces cf. hyalinus JEL632]|nr:hypothetical protein BJ741DRAFT_619960 [Chytriomyces cf. hyalinus JEL632]